MHARTHRHIRTYTHTHTRARTNTHTYMAQTQTRTHTHTHTQYTSSIQPKLKANGRFKERAFVQIIQSVQNKFETCMI